jgi:hypothetical protein
VQIDSIYTTELEQILKKQQKQKQQKKKNKIMPLKAKVSTLSSAFGVVEVDSLAETMF